MPIFSKITKDDVIKAFQDRFGGEPDFWVRTPGRVNLIGEHTDYNGGYVFPMTISRSVWMGARARNDGKMRVYSVNYDSELTCDLRAQLVKNQDIWFEYIKGCAWALQEEGRPLAGFDAVLMGDVPMGAGLASSAAMEVTSLLTFSEIGEYELSGQKLAKLGQRAENQWVGVQCGIMDQTICALGQEGKALLIDCNSLEHRLFELPYGTAVAVLDTVTRHSLAASAYNERHEQCEEACRALGIPLLREATQEMLYAGRGGMTDVVFHRARHVISENLRVQTAANALFYNDADLFGKLMNESHWSLRYDFEVSCEELDAMVDIARKHESCLGARMTGGGFGGSVVALLSVMSAGTFAGYVSERYQEKTGKVPNITICRATNGGRVERKS
ncbi:MAG: galactokinase [Synergistaceae bacterium]|nr:galactokinase [Synergistaceae bacterium]